MTRKLKHLLKTTSGSSHQQEIKEELSFNLYCKESGITPIKPDNQTFLKKVISKPQIKINYRPPEPGCSLINLTESQSCYYKPGAKIIASNLKLGNYPIDYNVDLHKLTQNEAIRQIQDYLNKTPNPAVIRFIHGQGHHSPQNQAVLIHVTRNLLKASPRVLAYSYAINSLGGNGVTITKLHRLK